MNILIINQFSFYVYSIILEKEKFKKLLCLINNYYSIFNQFELLTYLQIVRL